MGKIFQIHHFERRLLFHILHQSVSAKVTDSIYTILQTEAAHAPEATLQKAFLQYCLSHLSELKGDMNQAFIYAICSAITDIQLVNNDSQSMLYIIQLMNRYIEGEEQLERLYNYTQFCSENIYNYKDLGRSMQLIEVQNQVQKMYKQFISQKRERNSIIFAISIILFVAAGCTVYISYRRNKKKSNQYKTLQVTTKNNRHTLQICKKK